MANSKSNGQSEPELEGYDEYKEALRIDPNGLDTALMEQPVLFQTVAERFAEAMSKRDAAKDKIAEVDAGLSFDVRQELEEEIGKKPTESMVEAAINESEEHIEARNHYLELKRAADLWQTLRDSFMQRSHILRDLSNLYISGYFAQDAVSSTKRGPDEIHAEHGRKKVAEAKRGTRKSKSQ